MQVRKFSNPKQFQNHVKPFLQQNEAANHLILGILSDILSGLYTDYPPYLATVEDNQNIVLVALRTPPHNILLSTTENVASLEFIVKHLYQEYTSLPGISAPDDLAQVFVEKWKVLSGQSYYLKMHQGIYQLEATQPVKQPQGICRKVRDDDMLILVGWFQDFLSGISGEVSSQVAESTLSRLIKRPHHEAGLFVWVVDDTLVTMAAYFGATPNGCRVSYVYTPPKFRRNGYATACTAAVSQHALNSGRRYCFLYTDLSNPTSNHIYQEIGYEFMCSVKQYTFDALES